MSRTGKGVAGRGKGESKAPSPTHNGGERNRVWGGWQRAWRSQGEGLGPPIPVGLNLWAVNLLGAGSHSKRKG